MGTVKEVMSEISVTVLSGLTSCVYVRETCVVEEAKLSSLFIWALIVAISDASKENVVVPATPEEEFIVFDSTRPPTKDPVDYWVQV